MIDSSDLEFSGDHSEAIGALHVLYSVENPGVYGNLQAKVCNGKFSKKPPI